MRMMVLLRSLALRRQRRGFIGRRKIDGDSNYRQWQHERTKSEKQRKNGRRAAGETRCGTKNAWQTDAMPCQQASSRIGQSFGNWCNQRNQQ